MDDWLPDTTWVIAIGVIVLGAVYWFFFRDDNGFPEPEQISLKIKPVVPGMHKRKVAVVKRTDGIPVKVLFYTQTGTAEDFARRLGDDLTNYGFSPDVLEVEGFEGDSLAEEKMVVFFASTYGEGDPPDNAIEFHEWLMDSSHDSQMFSGLKYAVFGLGNKTYPEYNVIGKQIDKRMEELGATRIHTLGLGNDDQNIEDDFLVWKKGFAPVICKEFGLEPPGDLSQAKIIFKQRLVIHEPTDVKLRSFTKEELDLIPKWRKPKKPQTSADRNSPYLASILTKRELHKGGSGRSCLHLEVSTHNDILQYQPGDHIGVYPENQEHLVLQLAKLLQLDLHQVVSIFDINNDKPIVGPCSIRALLTQHFDIAFYAKKPLLRVLAQFATDKQEQAHLFKLSSDEPGNQDYENFIVKANRTIMEVLMAFPSSAQVPIAHFFEHLPKLQPRYYSISSSPSLYADTVHITAVVTNWTTPVGREANGVATTWFANNQIQPHTVVPAFIRKSNFKPPANLSTPMIMVGPGTGLAPFRGFLQEIKHRRTIHHGEKHGDVTLFFGCRSHEDYLYQEELETYHKEGVISKLHVAFSRVGPEKIYVQHLMKQGDVPKQIWDCIHSGGYFYVCGDAKLMARDVGEALVSIVSTCGGLSTSDAEKYIEKMIADARLQQDVWS